MSNAAPCQPAQVSRSQPISMDPDEVDEQLVVEDDLLVATQVPAKKPDHRKLEQLKDLIRNAPTLDQRMKVALKDMKQANTIDQHAAAPDTSAPLTGRAADKMRTNIAAKREAKLPLDKLELAFDKAEGERESISKEYDPDLTYSDFERKMHGLSSTNNAGTDNAAPLPDNLRTPCVISCGCANLGIMKCQFHAGGECAAAKPCKGRRVQCLFEMHACLVVQLGSEEQADLQIAAIGRGLSTQAGMEQRVRAGVVCDSMDCKLASGVEDSKRRAEYNEKTEQAANQSNGNTRYGSADLCKANLKLVRRLFVTKKIDEATLRSMVLDTANWTYWVSYRQRTFITLAKAFAENQQILGTKFNRDALQTMLDDFAHIPITYFNTIIADHIASPRSHGFSERRNRDWDSYFNDLFKVRAPEPVTTLFTWLRVMLWKQMGCRRDAAGKLKDVVDAENPAIDLYKDAMTFHRAMESILDGVSANKQKLKQRCTEEGETQGTRSAHISVQMAAAKKGAKDQASRVAFERRMFGSMMSNVFRGADAAPDVDMVVHKNLDYYAPGCCTIYGANNVHMGDRVSNAAKCLNFDLLFKSDFPEGDFSSRALLTLFLEGGTHTGNTTIVDSNGQRGWRVTAAEEVVGEVENAPLHRARFTAELPAYVPVQPGSKIGKNYSAGLPLVHGAPRTSAGPAALFDEHFVPRVGVPSGMGMLMPKPDDEHLSTKDQLHKKSIRMQSAERILEYHKDIRTAILTGNGIDADKPMTQDRRDIQEDNYSTWRNGPEELAYDHLETELGAKQLAELATAAGQMLMWYGRSLLPGEKCPTQAPLPYSKRLAYRLRAFVAEAAKWKDPLPQVVLSKAFRREPVEGLEHAPIKKAKHHAVTNYNSLVDEGVIDPNKYSIDSYTELEYKHSLLTNEVSRNRFKKTWRNSVLARMSTRTEAQQKRLNEAFLPLPSPVSIDRVYLLPEDPLGDAKEFATHHEWEAKCNQLLDEGALDEDLPLEPLNFAYWLHRQGIDPIERFSTDEDMRMLHAVQLYRVRLQELKVQAAKAREHMPIKYRKNTDQRNRFVAKYKRAIQDQYDAGCKELDLVYKREVGRWLYQDQTKPDGDPKYPMDDAMRAIEDGFMREMKGRFTGGYAHALERQRNIKSDRLKSVYDGATRNAAELELGREVAASHSLTPFLLDNGIDLSAILVAEEAQSETKGVADVIASLEATYDKDAETGGTFVGGAVVTPDDDGDAEAAPSPTPTPPAAEPADALEETDEMDVETAENSTDLRSVVSKKIDTDDSTEAVEDDDEMSTMKEEALKDQLANGTLTVFRPEDDYYTDPDWENTVYKNPRPALFGRAPSAKPTKKRAEPAPKAKPKPAGRKRKNDDGDDFNPMEC